MSFVVIENFKNGLDTRRSNLTSIIGTLQTLNNAHINQGGEIEKRKAFVKASFTPTVASGVTVIYDVIPLATTIALIGSQENADPGNWPPAGYIYQYLHRKSIPTTLPGGTYPSSPNYCAQCANIISDIPISTVIHSTSFGNKTVVLASMTDGTYCLFYDGNAVDDIDQFIRVLPDMDTNLKLFCMMARAFVGDPNIGQEAIKGYVADVRSTLDGINITGEVGRSFSVLVEGSGFATLPDASLVSNSTPSVPGKVATGYFTFRDGVALAGTNKITSVKVDVTELLNGGTAVDYAATPELTAAAIVASINAAGTAYNARNLGPSVVIYANATGTTANNKKITVTTAGQVMIGDCQVAFAGTGFTLDFLQAGGVSLLTGGFVNVFPTAAENLATFVGRVVTDINSGTGTHGYVAMQKAETLKVSRQVTDSTVDNTPIDVSITPAANQTGGANEGGSMAVQLDKSPIEVYFYFQLFGGSGRYANYRCIGMGTTTNPIKAVLTGGTSPFRYQWKVSDQNNCDISFEFPTADMTHVRDLRVPGNTSVGVGGSLANSIITAGLQKSANVYLEVVDFYGKVATSSTVPLKFIAQIV